MYAIEPAVEMIRVEYLEARNFYQRLGFNDIGPTSDQIEKACRARRKLFKDCFDAFDKDEWTTARNLVEEAYDCLIQPHLRHRYDVRLQRTINGGASKASNLVLGRYQVGQKLSEGDRTTIYEAHDNHLSRDCIIKKIHPGLLLDAEHQASLRREAELFASHNSGHLVKILDFDASRGILVLEKMSGNVSSLAKPGGVDSHLVYELLEQSLRGLDAMHSQGLAHGRIDHDHLLLDDRGQVKLSVTPGVSGIATAISPTTTTKHLAPEMLNPDIFGPRGMAIDLYSLGFVALELLVGKGFAKKVNPGFSPTGGDSQAWLLWHASATDHLPPIQELCPAIEPSLASVLEQMVVKDQNKRFASAGECLHSLAQGQKPAVDVLMPKSGRDGDAKEVRSIGSPDALTDTFQIDRSISWQKIWAQPQLLLSRDGRQHAAILSVGGLVTCCLMLILFGGSAPTTPEAQGIKPPPAMAQNGFELDPFVPKSNVGMFWHVTFDVEGGGKVTAVDSLERPNDSDEWELMPGDHQAFVMDSSGGPAREFAFTLAQGHGSITVPVTMPTSEINFDQEETIEQPNLDALSLEFEHNKKPIPNVTPEQVSEAIENASPPTKVENKVFHPSIQRMPIVGAENIDQAMEQTAWLKRELKKLCSHSAGEQGKALPFAIPPRHVDPRYCFVRALQSYKLGDKTKAQRYCQRSLDDSAYFGIVFMPIVQLSSRTHMMRGQCSNALADCRDTLATLHGRQTQMNAQEKADAMSELAWWTGTLVGVIENTEIDKGTSKADTEYTSHEFQQKCSQEAWQWFQAGRKRSADRAIELNLAWQAYQSHREGLLQKNKIQEFDQYEFFQDRRESEGGLLTPIKSSKARQPNLFSNYVPDDITVLAQRAYNSVATPKEYQQLTVRR